VGKEERDRGIAFEEEFAARFGVKPHRGSGNKWYARMDLGDGQPILWSLKSTKHASFSVQKSDIDEVVEAVEAPGGVGGDVLPGLGVRVADLDLVVLRADDFIALITESVAYLRPSKAEIKRANARVPLLFRDNDE
jgi:hypothetical protein